MTVENDSRFNMIPGIDISKWQGNSWDISKTIANGIKWIYIRAFNGTSPDPLTSYYAQKATDANIPFGFYSYFLPTQDVLLQAKLLADVTKQYNATLVPMYDIEEANGLTSAKAETYIRECDKQIGRNGIIYTSADIWNNNVKLTTFSDHLLWLPRYPTTAMPPLNANNWDTFAFNLGKQPVIPKGWSDWNIWQFSANGNKAAVNYGFPVGDLDLDILYAADWNKMLLNPEVPAKPEPKIVSAYLVIRNDSANKTIYIFDGIRARACVDQADVDLMKLLGATLGEDGNPYPIPSNIIDAAIALR